MAENNQIDKLELTRRKILAGIGTAGVAGAGAGLGTSALFSDEEQFANNQLTAGELDLKMSWEEHYFNGIRNLDQDGLADEVEFVDSVGGNQTGFPSSSSSPYLAVADDQVGEFMNDTFAGDRFPDKTTRDELNNGNADPCEVLADVPEDLESPLIELTDVKPGDFGEVTFDFVLCDNPGFLEMNAYLEGASENGVTEPEADSDNEEETAPRPASDDDSNDTVELLDEIEVLIWYDDGDGTSDDACDNVHQDGEGVALQSDSLRVALNLLSVGLPLNGNTSGGSQADRNCFKALERHCIGFEWELPRDTGNAVQSDEVYFYLEYYGRQCRNNDGSDQEPEGPVPGLTRQTVNKQQASGISDQRFEELDENNDGVIYRWEEDNGPGKAWTDNFPID